MKVEEFCNHLNSVPSKMQSLIPGVLEKCKPLVLNNILDNFARQESPDGIAWPERKKVGDGHPLLVETNTEGSGSLMMAATGQGAGHVSRVEGDTLVVGVDKTGGIGGIPGAGVHNYGYPPKNIPQREFMGIGEDTSVKCEDVLLEACLGVI